MINTINRKFIISAIILGIVFLLAVFSFFKYSAGQSCGDRGCSYSVSAPSGSYIVTLTAGMNDGGSGAAGYFCLSGSGLPTKCDVIQGYTYRSISGGPGYTNGEMDVYGDTSTAGLSADTYTIPTGGEEPVPCSAVRTCPNGTVITNNGFEDASGVCPVPTPPEESCGIIVTPTCPSARSVCFSAANSCGMSNSGYIDSNCSCTASTPSNNLCPVAPTSTPGPTAGATGAVNTNLVLQICPSGSQPPCRVGQQVVVGTTQQFQAWYSTNNGGSWIDKTNESDWMLSNSHGNYDLPDNDFNSSCSVGYCLTGRGVRQSPVASAYGPYTTGAFHGVVVNTNVCDESASGCPSVNANYSGTGAQVGMRVIPPPTPPPPVMSGTLTGADTCIIASGASTCNITFTWTTTNPVATSGVTKPVNVTVATGNSGTQAFTVDNGAMTFYLYNNAVFLAQKIVSGSCISGTTWSYGRCAVVVDTGVGSNNPVNITASSSNLTSGESTTIDWLSNVGACTGTNFSTGNAASGSIRVTPVVTTTYTVTCSGQSASVTVIVKKRPVFNEQ